MARLQIGPAVNGPTSMGQGRMSRRVKIGIVAPSSRLEPAMAERVIELAFHSQCFLSSGHFAGSDALRAAAFVEVANDPSFDALWFGRGGYGSCRIAEDALPKLNGAARGKTY